ncbi:MAG TPA: hypothetical protein VMU44_06600 [Steroidobacteraceae bacterium]|nr:hypothetical protein [Steroidobacteraceae bacterium]
MSAAVVKPGAAEPAAAAATVDERNPWLGLASFTEETRRYFFGRDEEVAELARRVQRKLLTVLFGQSGLGKTSILRAGIVPRLRGQGYCPIYVRIDYSREAPEPAEQIKAAIKVNARLSGEWTQAGVAVEGESLWEYLHHRDDVLRDQSGATLIPLLIFDQFEEIFTLAQSDEFGRARAARFVSELADLVENRPPKELESRFDADETAAARFDFARSDYRILIALREDYLAPLEGLKKEIPSISQNRLRLAPMTGTQALAAVVQPGKGLVTQEVAEAIVRFVAGGAELANAVVEPSLLSLICRELNDARLAQGRNEISLDLLAGSHATILESFYERALADQPAAVRRIIEDDLLTDSGFRESVAEENLVKRFTEAGAAPGTLALLVNRRLLRIEERLDVRRVELTHDVLCSVVKASRDRRQEREAREATERLLAEQHAREQAARRAAVRARQIAAGCTVLAAVAVVAAVFAWLNSQRAHRAEREAQDTRALAEQARGQAEHLLGYLSDDFGRELESFGRLDVLAEFSQRQIDYFHGLPATLRGTETVRNGALALVMHSRAMRAVGQLDVAARNAGEALGLLGKLRDGGDTSEATAIALALADAAEGRILEARNDPEALPTNWRGFELLQPLAARPDASVAVRRAYVQIGSRIGFEQTAADRHEDAVGTERQVMAVAERLGARELGDLDMSAYYAEAGAWMVTALESLGRYGEAHRISDDCMQVAAGVLARQPGHRLALHAEEVITGVLVSVDQDELAPQQALRDSLRQEQVSVALLNLDPANIVSINNLAVSEGQLYGAYWSAGRLREALPHADRQVELAGRAAGGGTQFELTETGVVGGQVYARAMVGDAAGAQAALANGQRLLEKFSAGKPGDSIAVVLMQSGYSMEQAFAAFERDDLAATERLATGATHELEAAVTRGGPERLAKTNILHFAYELAGSARYLAGDFPGSEQAMTLAVEARRQLGADAMGDRRELNQLLTWVAMAQARQGHTAAAAATVAPVVKFERALMARNHGDQWVPFEAAGALYAQALADRAQRAALLAEAAGLLDHLAPEIRALHDTRMWRSLIAEAQRKG